MTKEFIATGLSESQLLEMLENGETKGKCYLCKRSGDDEGVVIDEEGDALGGQIEIKNLSVQVNDEQTLHYPLCKECLILLHYISKMASEDQLPKFVHSLFSNN